MAVSPWLGMAVLLHTNTILAEEHMAQVQLFHHWLQVLIHLELRIKMDVLVRLILPFLNQVLS